MLPRCDAEFKSLQYNFEMGAISIISMQALFDLIEINTESDTWAIEENIAAEMHLNTF